MAIGKKTGGRSFPRGHKFAKGGRRNPPGGRPTNEARATKKAELEVKEKELAIAKDVWEKEIKSREQDLAKRYIEQAMKDNRVLLDLRKTRIVDVQSDKDTQDKPPVIYNYVDANTERNQARLEKRRSKSPQD